ncbi:alanine racemase [Methylobacterium fujisawaense]|uniref:Alanine racemase n=1 Tax=Methylobacterium fujisawaense TaxID=107400 RepID=A0ABR6D5D0_9HYPH|nr:alanine racemase [Methylobacterium fujisawaense]MBA9061301.1 alanine racemase [Methylobacterium fujisawaense]
MSRIDRDHRPDAGPAGTAAALLTIDLGAIADNYRALALQAGPAVCAAVVKADAYGLGAERVAPVLAAAGCRHFFVAQVGEGVALRAILGPGPVIAVLNGASPGSEATCAAHDLVPVLNDRSQRDGWQGLARRLDRRLPAILQIDSGMARFGFAAEEACALLDAPDALAGLDLQLVMSHLACAGELDSPVNAAQRAVFEVVRRRLPAVPASLAASSGIFLGPDFRFDLVRPGAALYGIAPQADAPNPMRPVIGLRARVMQTRSVPAGTPVGYGHAATVGRDSRLATVAIGYADGFFRSTAGGAAWFGGTRLPVVGRVSMDSLVLDVTDLAPGTIGPGALVDIIGPERDVDAVAAAAGTIGYEVLTNLGHRFHRVYLGA